MLLTTAADRAGGVHRGVGRRRGLRFEAVLRRRAHRASSRRWRSTARSTRRVRRGSWPRSTRAATAPSSCASVERADARHPRSRRHADHASGGERTAELIPGADLLLLADMGHDLPEPLWPMIVRRDHQPHHHVGGRRRHGLSGGTRWQARSTASASSSSPASAPARSRRCCWPTWAPRCIRVERAQAVRGPAPPTCLRRAAARPAQHRHRPQAPRRRAPRCSTSSRAPTR